MNPIRINNIMDDGTYAFVPRGTNRGSIPLHPKVPRTDGPQQIRIQGSEQYLFDENSSVFISNGGSITYYRKESFRFRNSTRYKWDHRETW